MTRTARVLFAVLAALALAALAWIVLHQDTAEEAHGVVAAGPEDRVVEDQPRHVVLRLRDEAGRDLAAAQGGLLVATRVGDARPEFAWPWSGGTVSHLRLRVAAAGAYDLAVEVPGFERAKVRVDVSAERAVEAVLVLRPAGR